MRIGPIVSGIISPLHEKKQGVIEPLSTKSNNIKEEQNFLTKMENNSKISTQDFIALRVGQVKESPFVELDQAIERINNNIEELGDILEGMIEKIQKVSKSSIGLQLLQQTFEAIDKFREGPK